MSQETAATPASLERSRLHQQVATRGLRATAVAVVVVIEVTGSLTRPQPGLSGDRLGILLGLVGIAVGLVGVVRFPRATALQALFFGLLVAGSVTLFWLQPNGPGIFGVFVAVSGAVLSVGPSFGAAVTLVAMVSQAVVAALAGGRSFSSVALTELGVIAFYAMALMARRLSEGQQRAEQLLAELEQSREAQATAAALAERQRLARDMHDVLAHSLSGLVLQLEGARLLASQRQVDSEVTEAVERAHHLAKSGLDEARRAIGLLRGEELPGPERLAAVVQSFERDTGIPCVLEISGAERSLDSEVRLTLYRVGQEALTNVRKHATPTKVEVHLAYEPDGTRLAVEDFGEKDCSVVDRVGKGYGLTGMRERAELIGGELTAIATKTGFRVELWVPV